MPLNLKRNRLPADTISIGVPVTANGIERPGKTCGFWLMSSPTTPGALYSSTALLTAMVSGWRRRSRQEDQFRLWRESSPCCTRTRHRYCHAKASGSCSDAIRQPTANDLPRKRRYRLNTVIGLRAPPVARRKPVITSSNPHQRNIMGRREFTQGIRRDTPVADDRDNGSAPVRQ